MIEVFGFDEGEIGADSEHVLGCAFIDQERRNIVNSLE